MNNYRMGAYALIAVGLINMRYQTGQKDLYTHSLIIIFPGVVLLLLTFISEAAALLNNRRTKILSMLIGVALITYSFLN